MLKIQAKRKSLRVVLRLKQFLFASLETETLLFKKKQFHTLYSQINNFTLEYCYFKKKK